MRIYCGSEGRTYGIMSLCVVYVCVCVYVCLCKSYGTLYGTSCFLLIFACFFSMLWTQCYTLLPSFTYTTYMHARGQNNSWTVPLTNVFFLILEKIGFMNMYLPFSFIEPLCLCLCHCLSVSPRSVCLSLSCISVSLSLDLFLSPCMY